ncbi:MAG: VIT1/CCC1 transporter family protein [Ignavibacteriaceae bacterium]|nr:VIT1/CCC1 transporter family protein [Ignavibacteriaceae bacterium]
MLNKNLWHRIKEKNANALDPIDRISEVLFGLIMVLSFTGSISVVSDGRAEISELLWAALGCNLAWGIIDGVFYLMGTIFSRGHGLSVLRRLKVTKDKNTSRNLLKDELPLYLSAILKPEEMDSINERLVTLESLPTKNIISSADLRAAFLILLLVFTCTFPVALPFIFLTNTAIALRISNGIALFILFFGGVSVGKYAGFHPYWTGTIIMVLGIILVAITIALGG